MARNRAVKTDDEGIKDEGTDEGAETGDSPTLPGGEGEGQEVPERDRARVERALMHLEFLEGELKGLTDGKSSLVGVMRQTAAKLKSQLGTHIHLWPPVKTIRSLLETVRDTLPKEDS